MRSILPAIAVSLVLGVCLRADEQPPKATGSQGRSVTHAPNGMVCACHPLAVQAGMDVLRKGGNAVDAAVAVNAALGVLEPMSCGIGGDLFAIVWDAKTGKLYGLNASGRAPALATRGLFAEKALTEIPLTGPLSWSVPGCVNGWQALLDRFGTQTMGVLLEPSIQYAEKGAPVPEVIAGYWKASEPKLLADPGSRAVFLPNGKAPAIGEVARNPALANTYRLLARDGAKAFYQGEIATSFGRFSQQVGGLIRREDLAADKPSWVDTISTTYRGVELHELPPNGQGLAALQILNTLENYDLRTMGFSSPEYWHLWIEAKKLAFADRARHYADPSFTRVPWKELASKQYAQGRLGLIKPDRVLNDVLPGDPKLGHSDTTYLCVVDKDRNCVSLIQSNYNGFGSGLTPPDLGFAIQNRGNLFSLDKNHPNTLEPGKRPFHTIIPAMALRDGKPWLVFGVMGGDMQPQGHAQIMINLLDFNMDLQEAGEAPRVEHTGSATPRGKLAEGAGTVQLEEGMPAAVMEGLKKLGHKVRTVRVNGGGYQAILLDPKTGILHGASDHRKDGMAAGY
ncbi:MAG: gamma-glutamyltransferase [Planctomycetota bacterium]|nr:gamma-glutamyltransferase [Planctomycetota bacterium]RLS40621.1 MAG: gamma-glutamyltransferase [Planctomycetota bacterium]